FFDGKKDVYGIVAQGKRSGDSLYFEWCNFAYSFGGGVFSKSSGWETWTRDQVILDHQKTIEATRFYKSVYGRTPDGTAATLDSKGQLARFLKGDVAMAIVWTDLLSELYRGQDLNRFGVHLIPGGKSLVGGGVCFVRDGSPNEESARRFVDGLFETDVQS